MPRLFQKPILNHVQRTLGLWVSFLLPLAAAEIFVSPQGRDSKVGTREAPLQSFAAAQINARQFAGKQAVTITFSDGVYYLPQTLTFTAADSGTAANLIVYRSLTEGGAIISGGRKLNLKWQLYRDGIFKASVPESFATDQLFINGKRQMMARYPNFDPKAQFFNGFSADAFSKERAAKWADPTGGFIHAMHAHLWGDYHYRITGKNANGEVTYEGGCQNNRQMGMHPTYRFVENIFEELDAPGEWFHDAKNRTLYFYPPAGIDLTKALVEGVSLRTLCEFKGSESAPVRFINLKGFTFRHSARTFMDNKEPLLRSDWTTYCGGAIFFNGAEDCAVEDSTLDQLGATSIFVNNYNRRIAIRGCLISGGGGGGISFIGDPAAVRSPLFEYNLVQDLSKIDRTPGPLTNNYPADCLVDDCLITHTGEVEKQTAPVQIEMSRRITLRHCTIHDVPRAGINIGSGCWGGHVIEGCDVFDTVKETGDHGSFNSWGRDRFWRPNIEETNKWVEVFPAISLLDVVEPITIRDSRWSCDRGWDIDLDDGSSNYHIYNNLCLNGGIKAREGFNRVIENNVILNHGFDPHVWYARSKDIVRNNIFSGKYAPARMHRPPWGDEMNHNLLQRAVQAQALPATDLQKQSGRDQDSIVANAGFVDPLTGDYRVKPGSPALALGFKNFPMDQFGVRKPRLKAMATMPLLPGQKPADPSAERDSKVRTWIGASVRNIVGQGEMSAYGIPGETGVLILDLPASSPLVAFALKRDDVILAIDRKSIDTVEILTRLTASLKPGQTIALDIVRSQKHLALSLPITTTMPLKPDPAIVQSADGSFSLTAQTAEIVGSGPVVEGGGEKNVGNWKSDKEFLQWQVKILKPGNFRVILTYALDPDSANSEINLSAGKPALDTKLQPTGGWGNYQTAMLGELKIDQPGNTTLILRSVKKPGEAVMNLRKIAFVPL